VSIEICIKLGSIVEMGGRYGRTLHPVDNPAFECATAPQVASSTSEPVQRHPRETRSTSAEIITNELGPTLAELIAVRRRGEIGPEVAKAIVNAEAAVRRLGVLWRSVARVYDETMAHRYGVVQ
jgi:hypothetical protein